MTDRSGAKLWQVTSTYAGTMAGILLGAIPPPHSVFDTTAADKKKQDRRREQSIKRREKNAKLNKRVFDLPPKWQKWIKKVGL